MLRSKPSGRDVYLDHAATTRLRPEVLAAMEPYFTRDFGNALSPHRFGAPAADAVADARRRVAEALGVQPREVYFTSGGTESDNLAVLGIARARKAAGMGNHLVTSAVEHPAVLEACRYLARHEDFRLTCLPVDGFGRVREQDVEAALTPGTALISVMAVNNVLGTLQPVEAIGALARERGVPFHCDAIQAVGKIPLPAGHADALALSGHKFYGPKGIGILYLRAGTPCLPASHGAGHEGGMRSGTHNTPAIAGIALALELAIAEGEEVGNRLRSLDAEILSFINQRYPEARHVGHPSERAAGTLTLSFPGLIGYNLLLALSERGVAVSSGPACHAADPRPQPVLTAIGLPAAEAVGSIRITMGRETRDEEIRYFLDVLPVAIEAARAAEPVPVT